MTKGCNMMRNHRKKRVAKAHILKACLRQASNLWTLTCAQSSTNTVSGITFTEQLCFTSTNCCIAWLEFFLYSLLLQHWSHVLCMLLVQCRAYCIYILTDCTAIFHTTNKNSFMVTVQSYSKKRQKTSLKHNLNKDIIWLVRWQYIFTLSNQQTETKCWHICLPIELYV